MPDYTDPAALRSLGAVRAAAAEILDNTDGDLTGADAERFAALTARAEALRDQQHREAEARGALHARLAAGELRTEGGASGGHTPYTATTSVTAEPTPTGASADAANIRELVAAVQSGRPHRTTLTRAAVTTALAGATTGVASSAGTLPPYVHLQAGIPFMGAGGLTVQGPTFAALVAQDATAQLGSKPEFTSPELDSATLAAFAVQKKVSDQLVRFGVGAQVVIDRLRAEVIYSINASVATALETAAGTPVTYTTSASAMADTGIASVWANTGQMPTAILVNPADYPALADKAAVGPGDGIGAPVVAFNGCPLLVNNAITAGVGVVLAGGGFSAHGTDVVVASLPVLTTNELQLLVEQYFALLQHDAAAAVAVELVAGE